MGAAFSNMGQHQKKLQAAQPFRKMKPIAHVAGLFMLFAVLNLIFGSNLSNHLINKHGQPGTGLVLREETTNTTFNDEPVFRYPVLLKKTDGQTVETYFETWDFNVYPNSESVRYPKVGEAFNLKYLEENPNRFIILANEGDYSQSLNCQELKAAMDEAERKMNFDEKEESFKAEFEQAKTVYENADCG